METGIYKYSVIKWDAGSLKRDFIHYKMKVEILEEKGARYLVRYKEPHARTQDVGGKHWVNKTSVTLSRPEVKPVRIDVRLPYKDND